MLPVVKVIKAVSSGLEAYKEISEISPLPEIFNLIGIERSSLDSIDKVLIYQGAIDALHFAILQHKSNRFKLTHSSKKTATAPM